MSDPKTPIVPTAWGGLPLPDARRLAQVIEDPGFGHLRNLLGERNKQAVRLLTNRETDHERAMFERGAMAVLQTLHEIIVALPNDVRTLTQQESIPDGSPDRNRGPGSEAGERGPE